MNHRFDFQNDLVRGMRRPGLVPAQYLCTTRATRITTGSPPVLDYAYSSVAPLQIDSTRTSAMHRILSKIYSLIGGKKKVPEENQFTESRVNNKCRFNLT